MLVNRVQHVCVCVCFSARSFVCWFINGWKAWVKVKQQEAEKKQNTRDVEQSDFIQLNLNEIGWKCFWNWYSGRNVNGEIGFLWYESEHFWPLLLLLLLFCIVAHYILSMHAFYVSCIIQIIYRTIKRKRILNWGGAEAPPTMGTMKTDAMTERFK